MEDNQTATTNRILEKNQRLSQSLLWQIERRFFERQGTRAWSEGKVPHYVTSNPFIAKAYGQVVFGFLRDYLAAPTPNGAQLGLDPTQPVYLLELGAGSGRFAYHFLKQFMAYYPDSALKHIPFKYVMTDLARPNLEFWQTHPALQPFVDRRVLDFAMFDAAQDADLRLEQSGQILSAETMLNPLIVIANYFFDSLPQDLFSIRDGQLYETLLTLTHPEADPDLGDPEFFTRLDIAYEDRPATTDYYDDPDFNQILDDYQQRLAETTLLFPYVGLQCVRHLRRLAGDRLLFLSGDKGYSREDSLLGRGKPKLSLHQGCFSLMVNYHALAQYVRSRGGQALTLPHRPASLCLCTFLFGQPGHDYLETRQAFRQAIAQGGPDDFFALKKGAEKHYDAFTLPQLLGYLRLSGWDANIFFGSFPTLMEHAAGTTEDLARELSEAVENIWQMYYFIGESRDLPFHLAMLLYALDDYVEALVYFRRSLDMHGEDPNTFYNMALCYDRLDQPDKARDYLDQTLVLDPNFEAAGVTKIEFKSQPGPRPVQLPAAGYRLPISGS